MTAPACRIDDAVRIGHRTRATHELHADLIAGCRTLGQLSDEWFATGHVPPADLAQVDTIAHGLHSLLVALRAQGGDHG